ncbi:alcohol dehydrogenase [Pseudonocardia sp. CNS-004]|nr:alcohol dehydrogenase [Pseudonocardia sp. CNS-004]
MKALVAAGYGPPEQLAMAQVPVPTPGPGQIQVRIAATSINPTDMRVITGGFKDFVDIEFPYVPGNDFAGTVTAIGEGVERFEVGDEVFGQALPRQMAFASDAEHPSLSTGALAEYAVFEADTPLVATRPPSVPADEAAALAIAGWTALGLMKLAQVRPGETCLVVGGLGGVGTALIPLLVGKGARVIATARTAADVGLLQDLAVTDTVGYAEDDYPRDVDLVFNLALPAENLPALGRPLRPGGRLVSIIWPAPTPEQVGRDDVQLLFFLDMAGKQVAMREVADAAAAGELRARIGRKYSLDAAVDAAVAFHSGGIRGKVVVTI